MNNDWLGQVASERELRGEATSLLAARRMVIMVIEPTFADGYGTLRYVSGNLVRISQRIKAGGVVRMDASGKKHDTGIDAGDLSRASCRGERFTNTDDRTRTCCSGTLDGRRPIDVESRIRQMRVAIDEREH
jgi:hypothetical protein